MQAESNIKPNKFNIENILNGNCEIVFFDNIQEIEKSTESEEKQKAYIYDTYRLRTRYRDDLEQELNDDNILIKWLQKAKDSEYEELATQVREKRNELLQKSDKFMCLDRLGIEIPENITPTSLLNVVKTFFEGLSNSINGNYAKYRQELRDITKQAGFPYNVEFPIEPSSNESEE